MKKRGWMVLLALLGSLLLTSAMAWTEADYRTVTVDGYDYVLGEERAGGLVSRRAGRTTPRNPTA